MEDFSHELDDLSQLSILLLAYETLLLDPARRANPDSVANVFAEDFREFGKSGRSYDKAEILEFLRHDNLLERRVTIENFKVTMLADSAALATYITVVAQGSDPESRALRSSIWVNRDGVWQIVFHQGTATDCAGPSDMC